MDTGGADAPPAGDLVSAHDGDQWVTWGGDGVSISSDSNQAGFEESSVTLRYLIFYLLSVRLQMYCMKYFYCCSQDPHGGRRPGACCT